MLVDVSSAACANAEAGPASATSARVRVASASFLTAAPSRAPGVPARLERVGELGIESETCLKAARPSTAAFCRAPIAPPSAANAPPVVSASSSSDCCALRRSLSVLWARILEYLRGLFALANVWDARPRQPFAQRVVRDLDRAVDGSADDKCALDRVTGSTVVSAGAVVALAELVPKRLELAFPGTTEPLCCRPNRKR